MKGKNMQLESIPASKLKHLEHNARKLKHSQGIQKLADQIRIHGFQSPLNVWLDPDDDKYAIIAGNHRFKAGKTLGMKEFPCVVYQGTREQAYARSISDNKMSELTGWDMGEFSLAIKEYEIQALDCGFDSLKFNEIANYHEKEELKAKIKAEKEYHYQQVDIDKLLAKYSQKLMSIWQEDPESMSKAVMVILPTDSGNQAIMIMSDPSTSDIITELQRYAASGEKSPLEKLTQSMVNYEKIVADYRTGSQTA
jgi:hypothetical protein